MAERDTIVAWISGGSVTAGTFDSCLKLAMYDAEANKRISTFQGAVGPYIAKNRNDLIRLLLADFHFEWLFWLDVDMTFKPTILKTLHEAADATERPIVGALYFNRYEQYNKQWLPTWLEERSDGNTYIMENFKFGQLQPLAACGMGCTLIHRSVFEKMEQAYGDNPWPWYDHDVVELGGKLVRAGEDVTFCARARELGFPVYGLGVAVAQTKTANIGIDTYNSQRVL